MAVYCVVLIVWNIFESIISSACIFGWAQLVEVLENEQYFSSYCDDEASSNKTAAQINNTDRSSTKDDVETCSKRDSVFRLAYTIAVFALYTSIFAGGKFMDMFGFRKTRRLAR